jgi:hypothetical protein
MDFAGPFRTKSPGGYNRIVIFTDAFTKLAIFVKCRTTLTAEGIADLYIEHVWKVYGRIARLQITDCDAETSPRKFRPEAGESQ